MAASSWRWIQSRVEKEEPGRVAAGVVAPAVLFAVAHLAGADDGHVAAADAQPGFPQAVVEVVLGDGVAGLQVVETLGAGHVEEQAATDDLVPHGLDTAGLRAGGADEIGGAAVPHAAAIEDVGEGVPLGSALEGHGDGVVGVAQAAGQGLAAEALGADDGVGAGGDHLVDRVEAAGGAGLRPVRVQRHAQGDDLTLAHQMRRLHDLARGDVVEGAELVVGAPLAPVAISQAGLLQLGGHVVPPLASLPPVGPSGVLGVAAE